MKNREDITNLLNPRSIGCELGVFKGDFSKVLLDSGKFDQLYLVDPFSGQIQSGDKNGNNVESLDGEGLFSYVSKRFECNSNVFVTRQRSHEFLSIFKDDFFDFIYIDTTHQYDQTILELELAYKKIKNNGNIKELNINVKKIIKTNKIAEVIFVIILLFFIIGFLM